MKKQIIILLPVDDYDRRGDAENNEGRDYKDDKEIRDTFPIQGWVAYSDMSEYMDDFNNELIADDHYWLTYGFIDE